MEARLKESVGEAETPSHERTRADILEGSLRGRPAGALLGQITESLRPVLANRRSEIRILDTTSNLFLHFEAPAGGAMPVADPTIDIVDSNICRRLIDGETVEIATGTATLHYLPLLADKGTVVGAFSYVDSADEPLDRANHGTLMRWLELAGLIVAQEVERRRLIRSEALATDLAEVAFDWCWETDEYLQFTKVWGAKLTNVSEDPEFYPGKTRADLALTKTSPGMLAHMADLEARRPFKDFVYAHRNEAGEIRYARVSGSPIYRDDGSFAGYRGGGTIVTAEEETRMLGEAAHQVLGRAIEGAATGYVLYDSDDRLLLVSQSILDFDSDNDELFVVGEKYEDLLRKRVMRGRYSEAIGREEEYIADRLERFSGGDDKALVNWGDDHWVRVEERRLPDGRLLKLIYDVTSLKDRERELEEKSHLLQATLDNIDEAVFVLDEDLKLFAWNDRYFEMYGFPDSLRTVGTPFENLIRKGIELGYHEGDDPDEVLRIRMNLMRRALNEDVDFIRYFPDGRVLSCTRHPFPGGGVIDISRDVTDNHRREEALRNSEATLRAIFETAGTGIAVLSPGGDLLQVNPAFENFLGYSNEELIGTNHLDHNHPDENEGAKKRFKSALDGETKAYTVSKRYVRKDGSVIWGQGTLSTLTGEDGRPTLFILLVKDVTEERSTEASLIEAKEAAKKVSRVKSEFLANVSHEIRTPMNSIIGFGKLLSQTELDERQETFVGSIGDAAKTLMGLINDVLDLSKLESGNFKIDRREFHLQSAVESTIDIARGMSENSGLPLELEFEPLPSSLFEGDSKRLQQVLLNLLGNAIKFTKQGQVTVRVSGRREGQDEARVTFEVQDTGIGIDSDVLPELFQPFVQADGSISRRYGGTGLGLSISKNLVELMGGEIGADSVLGQGSRFWFTIPMTMVDGSPETPVSEDIFADEDEIMAVPKALEVLVVEDNEANSLLMLTLLQRAGHKVVMAENGTEACAVTSEQKFDVILMDVQMPVCDGLTATRSIRDGEGPCKDVPIVAVTAHAMAEDRDKCIDAGMNDHLTKPVNARALAELLARVCSGVD